MEWKCDKSFHVQEPFWVIWRPFRALLTELYSGSASFHSSPATPEQYKARKQLTAGSGMQQEKGTPHFSRLLLSLLQLKYMLKSQSSGPWAPQQWFCNRKINTLQLGVSWRKITHWMNTLQRYSFIFTFSKAVQNQWQHQSKKPWVMNIAALRNQSNTFGTLLLGRGVSGTSKPLPTITLDGSASYNQCTRVNGATKPFIECFVPLYFQVNQNQKN